MSSEERPGIVPIETLLHGFVQAHERFEECRVRREEERTFFALFEALNWAVALDERIATSWASRPNRRDWSWRGQFEAGGKVMAALRYARHSVHHQWADALRLDDGGVSFPLEFPLRFFDWYWRYDIPPPNNREGAQEYDELLAGEPTRHALGALRELFPAALAALQERHRNSE